MAVVGDHTTRGADEVGSHPLVERRCHCIADELAAMPFPGDPVDLLDQIRVDLNVHSNV